MITPVDSCVLGCHVVVYSLDRLIGLSNHPAIFLASLLWLDPRVDCRQLKRKSIQDDSDLERFRPIATDPQVMRFITGGTPWPDERIQLFLRRNQEVRTIRDLKAVMVAVTAPGSPVHVYVDYLLVKNGLSPEDVSAVGTPSNAARVSALEHGKVNAAMLGEPGFMLLVRRHPGLTILADLTTRAGVKENFGTDVYPGTVLLSTGAWLQENPTVARDLARAVQRSLQWCRVHNSHEIAEKMPAALRIDDRVAYEQASDHMINVLSPDGFMPAEAVEAEDTCCR
jgi:ABC-type nitrate/sulfonate/bicarbonate transport system substrate-binding protein